jgi:hypothetical protein
MIGMFGGQSLLLAGVIVALAAIVGAACFTSTLANSSDGYNNDTINRRDRAEFSSMRRDAVIGGAVGGRNVPGS